MNLKKNLLPALLFTVIPSLSFATVYEDWSIYDNKPSGATISNEFDTEAQHEVVVFEGAKRKNSYILGGRKSSKGWNNSEEFVLQWKMKFAEKYKITLYAQTSKGLRIFKYDYKNQNKGLYKKRYIHVGLGKSSMNGSWKEQERDIASDLKKYEPDNNLISINGLKIQGSGKIDYLKLENKPNSNNQELIQKAKEHCLHKNNSTSEIFCSNEENIVYIMTDKIEASGAEYFSLHKISIEANNEFTLLLRERSSKPSDTRILESFKKLEDTPIYIIVSSTEDATPKGSYKFFYQEKKVLSFNFREEEGLLNDIKTFENGKKLSLSYFYLGDATYTEIYDISNPANPKLINKEKVPF